MTAIPKAIAMANPKHVVACMATVAGVISSKFAIDSACDDIEEFEMDEPLRHKDHAYYKPLTENYKEEAKRCLQNFNDCQKTPAECASEYTECLEAIRGLENITDTDF